MKATTFNREVLVKATAMVRPALASQAYIPALTHIKFDGDFATAYNDITAISVRCKADVERCLPGDLLIRALGSFGGETIAIQDGKESDEVVLSSGRAKIKLPTLELKTFPFKWPGDDEGDEVAFDRGIIKGIERCLISVNTDPTHPAQMGVTLEAEGGRATLYSTDNFSMSRYRTSSKLKLPADVPVIMPRFFCEQVVALAKVFNEEEPVLILHNGALEAQYGNLARVFSKTPVDLEPMDFKRMFNAHASDGFSKVLGKIPDAFEGAFNRALLVLSSEMDKVTRVTVENDVIRLFSSSTMGDADDTMHFDGEPVDKDLHVDPGLVARASGVCTRVGFTGKVTILTDDSTDFTHLIAHCTK